MHKKILGKNALTVDRIGLSCILIQRIFYEESTVLLQHAYENGVTLYDTAKDIQSAKIGCSGQSFIHVRDRKIVLGLIKSLKDMEDLEKKTK